MNENYGFVSVMMPAYNAEKYIEEAINSILSQTYPYFELIIVDDGSTDRTSEIVHSFKDEGIVYIKHTKNMGVSEARNTALRVAKGKWGALADADDVWLPERLEKLLSAIEAEPYGKYFVADNHTICFNTPSGLEKWKLTFDIHENINIPTLCDYLLPKSINMGIPVAHPLFPLQVVQDKNIWFDPNISYGEDFKFVCFLFKQGLTFRIIPDSYYLYRQVPGSLTSGKNAIKGPIDAIESLLLDTHFSEKDHKIFEVFLKKEKKESFYREFVFYLKKRNFSKALALALKNPSLPFKLVARLPKILRYRLTAKIKGWEIK